MYGRVLRCLAASTAAWMLSGCGLLLDFDPPDLVPGSQDGSIDADLFDGGADTGLGDGSIMLDADLFDGSLDADLHRDANLERDGSVDSDVDAVIPPDPCNDELGLCIRMSHESVPDVMQFRSNMYWTEGGVTVESGWTFETCVGGLRIIDATTIDCLFHARPLPRYRNIYFYPRSATRAGCDAASCPGFPDAWEYWVDGVSVPGTPGLGPISMERRPTPDGMIMAIKYTVP